MALMVADGGVLRFAQVFLCVMENVRHAGSGTRSGRPSSKRSVSL
jgi:hypothetical protein